jgi:diadenosine tetraphosphatase ApaH/serine/threonine PP2A family protein phosphatase
LLFVKIGIYSDIHSNAEAFEAVLEALEKEHVERTLCLGDVVGYGPDPNLCVERAMRNADEILAGNHDHAAIGRLSIEDFNEAAAKAIEWTKGVLSQISAEFLNRLPLEYQFQPIMAVHATPEAPDEWLYIVKKSDIERNLVCQNQPICFFGHSHVPVAFSRDDQGDILIQEATEVRFKDGWKYLINVGSVGQPRDGDPRAAYGIVDTEEGCFRLKRADYPIERVQKKMADEGLPERLIRRLSLGQ